MTTARFRGTLKEKYFIIWLIINKPQPNHHLGDTFIQGTLSLVPIEASLYM